MKHLRLILAGAGVLALVAALYLVPRSGLGVDRAHPPQFIQAEFIDLSRIYSVSKFRSGMGLDYSGDGESCRNLKHYYIPQSTDQTAIPIFAPVDGRIASVAPESNSLGQRVLIHPSSTRQFAVRLFHIRLAGDIRNGTQVAAGQQIGTIGAGEITDIDIQVGQLPWSRSSVSYFQVMPDRLFDAYRQRGVVAREELIITRADRDAKPLQCQGSRFVHPDGYDREQDVVRLSGYRP